MSAGAGRWRLVGQESPIPEPSARVARFESLAFGLFVHWGLYAQLGAGEWAKHHRGMPTDEYMLLMQTFTARDFSGKELARAARRGGMRYATLTSRHHDGFSLYDTRGLSPYDVTHTPAGRDLIADFVGGCRGEGIVPMLYCTTLDWSDPRFENDWSGYQSYLRASVEILCREYGEIGGFWFDGNWSRPGADWELDALYGVIRKHQPEAMIIDNTGIEHGGRVGHPEIDSVTFEQGQPKPLDRRGHPKYVAGEMCQTFNFHWGLATRDFNYLSPAHVIESLCSCRRTGANLLFNVGPTAQGAVPGYERAALERVGDWLELHGGLEGPLYQARPCGILGAERDFGLAQGDLRYLFVFDLTATADSRVGVPSRGAGTRIFQGLRPGVKRVTWLDNGEELRFEQAGERLMLQATGYPYGTNTVVRVARVEG
jgi:alpha-L-fucosidase